MQAGMRGTLRLAGNVEPGTQFFVPVPSVAPDGICPGRSPSFSTTAANSTNAAALGPGAPVRDGLWVSDFGYLGC